MPERNINPSKEDSKAPRIRNLDGFFVDAEGNLHRGYPVVTEDAQGKRILKGHDNLTGTLHDLPPEIEGSISG